MDAATLLGEEARVIGGVQWELIEPLDEDGVYIVVARRHERATGSPCSCKAPAFSGPNSKNFDAAVARQTNSKSR